MQRFTLIAKLDDDIVTLYKAGQPSRPGAPIGALGRTGAVNGRVVWAARHSVTGPDPPKDLDGDQLITLAHAWRCVQQRCPKKTLKRLSSQAKSTV